MTTRKLFVLGAALASLTLTTAQAQEPRKFFIEGDIVRGNSQAGMTGPICVLANQFKRKEVVVFRMRVTDITGKPLDDKALKGITVELSDGNKLKADWRLRPPKSVIDAGGLPGPVDAFWTAAWTVPETYPTGTLGFRYVVTDASGHTQTWEPLREFRSLPTILDGVAELSPIVRQPPPPGFPNLMK